MLPYIKVNKLHIDNIPDSEISFSVEKGEVIGITGACGSGKSSLAMYLAGFSRPDAIGRLIIGGLDPFSQLDEEKLHRVCGMVFQNPRVGIVYENVGRDLIFGAENQGLEKDKIVKRASFYMKKYNLRKKGAKNYNNLSASEQQRVALSSSLIMHPELLILDEAFSMQCDADINKYLSDIIKSARKRNQTVVIFSKRRSVLEKTDRVYELYDGHIRNVDLEHAEHLDMILADSESFKVSDEKALSVSKVYDAGYKVGDSIMVVNHMSYGYDDNLIIDDVNEVFNTGSVYRISGGHSRGKSTYLQLLAGLIKPYEGTVAISEDGRTGYIYQYPEDGFVADTVLDDVMFGPMSDGYAKVEARNMAINVLKFVGVGEELWDRSPLKLSAGEQELVAIAGALALNPEFLLIDEPYAGLDMESRKHIEMIIKGLSNEGKCIITVEA